jgi:hypothetical protein
MNADLLHDGDLTGGLSNYTLLLICCTGITLVVSSLVLLCHRSSRADVSAHNQGNHDASSYEEMLERMDVSLLTRTQRRARAKLLMRKNRRLASEHNADVPEQHNEAHDRDQENNIQIRNTTDGHFRPFTSRKERKERAKALEKRQREIYDKARLLSTQLDNLEKERDNKTHIIHTKKMIEEKERKEALMRQKLHWKYMFDSNDREKSESLITVHDFIKDAHRNPVQSISSTASRLLVSTTELLDRLQELEKEGRIPLLFIHQDYDCFSVVNLEHMKQIVSIIQDSQSMTMQEIARDLPNILQCQNVK